MEINMEMQKFEIKKVAGPLEGGAAIFLANPHKAFVIFVGLFEATAIAKELQKQSTIRPLTHDLFCNVLEGFDIKVKKVMISKIVDNTFCATLVLEQKILDGNGEWDGKTREVHVDARASDSIVIALKTGNPVWVSREVYEKVDDVSQHLEFGGASSQEEDGDSWKNAEVEKMDFEIPDYPPDDEEDDEGPF